MPHTDWHPKPKLDTKRKKAIWYHTAPHHINDGEVDGEVSFSDEVLEPFRDDDE